MRVYKLFFTLLSAAVLFTAVSSGCSLFILGSNLTPAEYLPKSMLVIADERVYSETSEEIAEYQADISKEGIASALTVCAGIRHRRGAERSAFCRRSPELTRPS